MGNPLADGPQLAAQLRDAAIKSLTQIIISLDIPKKDPRLLKVHVEYLFRILDTTTTIEKNALSDRRLLAADCLQMLEAAFPTLLSLEASTFLQLAKRESVRPTPGFVCIQLAATVLSNVAAEYLKQQRNASNTHHDEDSLSASPLTLSMDDSLSEDGDIACAGEEFSLAQDVLLIDGSIPSDIDFDTELDQGISDQDIFVSSNIVNMSSNETSLCDVSNNKDKERATDTQALGKGLGFNESNLRSGATTPKSALHAAAPSVATTTAAVNDSSPSPAASSALSDVQLKMMLPPIDVIEKLSSFNETPLVTPRGSSMSKASAAAVGKSALTAALNTASMDGAAAWTVASTPRCAVPVEVPLLQSGPLGATGDEQSPSLRKFTVPLHLQTGDENDAPVFIMSDEAQAALQDAVFTFLGGMRRFDPGAIARVSAALPALIRLARPLPAHIWPLFERLLSTGSVHLLRAVLDIHDALPEIFEGRDPSLVEKVLAQVNDPVLSSDHRVAAVSWVLRQHAAQRDDGGALLLADCWEQLLPRGKEPIQLATLKFKALASCVASGVGDEEVICRAVCSWPGFDGVHPTEHQLRTLTFALRSLLSAAPVDAPSAPRVIACLVTGILEAIIMRPQLCLAVDALLDTCSDSFADVFLRSFNALLSSVDGQFEVLRERYEDSFWEDGPVDLATRIKAAVLSRSTSLSGMLRGLSFRLSFTKRTHSSLQGRSASTVPLTSRYVGDPTQRVDVSALRTSITDAFQQKQELADARSAASDDVIGAFKPVLTPRGSLASSSGPWRQSNRLQTPRLSVSLAQQQSDQTSGKRQVLASSRAQTPRGTAAHAALLDASPFAISGGEAPRSPGTMDAPHHLYDHAKLEADTVTMYGAAASIAPAVPAVPLELPDWECSESWLTSPGTWESLASGVLNHDLMAYRSLILRVLRSVDVQPRGTLRTLANYTWQYKESHPMHCLSAKETAAAILALCQTAALAHLPCPHGDGWAARQTEVADSVQFVLDALEEGFPVPSARARSQILAELLNDESCWGAQRKAHTLGSILSGYIDSAIEG